MCVCVCVCVEMVEHGLTDEDLLERRGEVLEPQYILSFLCNLATIHY